MFHILYNTDIFTLMCVCFSSKCNDGRLEDLAEVLQLVEDFKNNNNLGS